VWSHTNTNDGYTAFIKTRTINTHLILNTLKLTVKNKDVAYAEQLIPHSQCVVMYKSINSMLASPCIITQFK